MRTKIATLFLFIGTLGLAQRTEENKLGSWHAYFGTNRISDKFSIHTEVQLRYFEQGKSFNQSVLRSALNYHINPDALLSLGYTNLVTDTTIESLEGETNINEHHIYADGILKNKVWELGFEHRFRFENRFIDFGDTKDTQQRLRYRLLLNVPLTDIFFINLYEELFVNFQNEVYDQNWTFIGLGANVTNNLSLQAGYIKINTESGNFDRLVGIIIFNPDLRKKKRE
ncbi:DUF2490 domain-containing protein [Aggregatimonas sangjinii]|uniref:DUF2490 domain-containing protein n=1 Tax=Aggregatimonas sangjinii TaxID=2583587 RepID=A0A5B7STP4_9FLAO|nr:DUF2490 domain-containing protein [Aggregatimonas sangjinii]QCX00423.1 DUF2490 domain-containing protein [Aggregatimonas sangjinii]